MPGKGQWRHESAYDYIDNLDPAALAWEFLRRNHDYRREYASVARRGRIDTAAAADLAQHWGMRFRAESRNGGTARHEPLESPRGPGDDPPAAISVPNRKPDHH
jgi:hypothetical protein